MPPCLPQAASPRESARRRQAQTMPSRASWSRPRRRSSHRRGVSVESEARLLWAGGKGLVPRVPLHLPQRGFRRVGSLRLSHSLQPGESGPESVGAVLSSVEPQSCVSASIQTDVKSLQLQCFRGTSPSAQVTVDSPMGPHVSEHLPHHALLLAALVSVVQCPQLSGGTVTSNHAGACQTHTGLSPTPDRQCHPSCTSTF